MLVRGLGTVHGLEFVAGNEALGHLGQAAAALHVGDPAAQTGQIGRAGEGGLVQAVDLAGGAVHIQGQVGVQELQALDVEQAVGAVGAAEAVAAGVVGNGVGKRLY